MRARPVEEWKDWNVTARDIVSDADVTVSIACDGCRKISVVNIWKVGERLADTPLQRLRLRCQTCGMYPSELVVEKRMAPKKDHILTVPLNPAFWDDEHETNQKNAKARAEKRWEAVARGVQS